MLTMVAMVVHTPTQRSQQEFLPPLASSPMDVKMVFLSGDLERKRSI